MTETIKKQSPESIGITFLVFLGMICLFFYAVEMVAPIVLATLLFFLIDPLVTFLQKFGIPRAASSILLMLFAMFAIFAICFVIYDGGAKLTAQMPQYSQKIRGIIDSLARRAASFQKNTERLLPATPLPADTQKVQVVTSEASTLGSTLFRGVNSVFSMIANLLLIPILSVFFILEKKYLRIHFKLSLGETFPQERVCSEISAMVRAYFFGNLIVGLLTSIVFWALFWVLGLENSLVLALLAGFLNLIPIFGAFIGGILPAAQALLQFDHFSQIIVIFSASILLHVIVNSVVIPKMIGSRINVNASAATLGLIFWGWVWGGLGLLLAIPLMALVRIGLSTHRRTLPWSNLIAENSDFSVLKVWKNEKPVAGSR
ncbi:MAG: AI-2E family transporter [Cryobacterium sp.]|nr:AI-2E family transporter [Oligoflexia bacterium]